MTSKIQVRSLSDLQVPLLTAYIHTNLAMGANQGLVPAYLTWLKTESKSFASSVLPAEQKNFQEQVSKVEEFLRNRKAKEKSLAILSGPEVWEVIQLQVEVRNAIHWGRPALAQLLSLQNMHKPWCVAVVDRAGVRFFQYALGEWTELGEMKFDVDVAQWKRKDIGHLAHPGIKTTRGSQRDTFEHRVDAQYARLCRQAAEQMAKLSQQHGPKKVFLVGSPRLVEPIEAHLPDNLRSRTVLIREDLGRLTMPRLKTQLGSLISDWESQHGERNSARQGKRAEGKAYGSSARG